MRSRVARVLKKAVLGGKAAETWRLAFRPLRPRSATGTMSPLQSKLLTGSQEQSQYLKSVHGKETLQA